MTISNGIAMNKITSYPPTKTTLQDPWKVLESCENTKFEPPKNEEIESSENA
jgi:hypothetical protein